ncbi:MAG: hypothetical protein KC729_05045, partial [Candidatus Eisenbacteria bacterium]|nr:hypothetical protein [Candidatus Eisenbacteria bacterium]
RAHQGRRWALGAFAFAILALGPRLHVNGEVLPVPLPQAIVSHLPILGGTRTPIRYLAAAQLFLAMAVAMGWAGWQRSGRRGAIARDPEAALTVPSLLLTRGELLIGAAILLTCLSAPLRFTAEPIPRVYETIRQRSAGETATLLHVPGMLAREDLLYQTVHRQRLVDDVSSAMPLHTGSEDALRTQAWETFALGFAQPGFVKNLTEDQRGALQQMAREYFGQFGIRWVVVPSDPAHQMAGSADRLPHNMVGPTAYQAYRENFKLLEPVWEQEKDGVTVFEF